MKFSLRDIQTDFSIHGISSSRLIHLLLDKKIIEESSLSVVISKIADLHVNKSMRIKNYSIIRTD